MAREAVIGAADALFISCTNLPTYDAIPQLEAELRMPVLSANQVTMWAALRAIGAKAVGPYQALLMEPEALAGTLPGVPPATASAAEAGPETLPEEQEGWT
jgi:maleate isomerase